MTNQTKHNATVTDISLSQTTLGAKTFDQIGTKTFTDIGTQTFDQKYLVITNQALHSA